MSDIKVQKTEDQKTNSLVCSCCEPPQNLFPRPDLAQGRPGQRTPIAICIMHVPPTVYVFNHSKQEYEKREELELKDNQIFIKESGKQFIPEIPPPSIQELEDFEEIPEEFPPDQNETRDLNEGGSTPSRNTDVNLDQDQYYEN